MGVLERWLNSWVLAVLLADHRLVHSTHIRQLNNSLYLQLQGIHCTLLTSKRTHTCLYIHIHINENEWLFLKNVYSMWRRLQPPASRQPGLVHAEAVTSALFRSQGIGLSSGCGRQKHRPSLLNTRPAEQCKKAQLSSLGWEDKYSGPMAVPQDEEAG